MQPAASIRLETNRTGGRLHHRHRSWGLRLAANQPLPGLPPDPNPEPPDLRIHLAPSTPAWRARCAGPGSWQDHPLRDERGRPLLRTRRRPDAFQLRYADGTEFLVDPRARWIRGAWPAPFGLADAATYLVGPVLAFARRLRGGLSLHASTVVLDGAAVAFLGPSGAGKSTLAAAFARRGVPVLCDDAAALDLRGGEPRVEPGCARVRLWPGTTAALYGRPDALPRLTPHWDKRYLPLAEAYDEWARPLRVVYLLRPRETVASTSTIRPLPRRTALVALLAHSYASYFQDAALRAREFRELARLVERIAVRELVPAAGLDRLDGLCTAIVADAGRVLAARRS